MDGGAAALEEWAGWTRWSGRDPFEDHCGPYHWRELDQQRWPSEQEAAARAETRRVLSDEQ